MAYKSSDFPLGFPFDCKCKHKIWIVQVFREKSFPRSAITAIRGSVEITIIELGCKDSKKTGKRNPH